MEFHIKELKKVCRVCGNRTNKAKGRERVHLVAQHKESLATVFSLDVSGDTVDTHPIHLCHSCKTLIRCWEKRGGAAPAVERVYKWTKHSDTDCKVRGSYLVT
jgi:hypothetical protein